MLDKLCVTRARSPVWIARVLKANPNRRVSALQPYVAPTSPPKLVLTAIKISQCFAHFFLSIGPRYQKSPIAPSHAMAWHAKGGENQSQRQQPASDWRRWWPIAKTAKTRCVTVSKLCVWRSCQRLLAIRVASNALGGKGNVVSARGVADDCEAQTLKHFR